MNRRTLSPLAGVIAIAALYVAALSAAPTVKQIHPVTTNPNAPVRIAIIADHYTLAQKQEFDYDVENFIKYGLLADGFYKTQAGSMDIASYFEATPAGQESRFGFEIGLGDGNCAVKAPADILKRLSDATGSPTVLPTRYVVIANHPYNIGCTSGDWSYVAVDAVGTDVFQHELGHLIGLLLDEWALPSNGTATHPGLFGNQYNCAPSSPDPYWMNNPNFPGAQKLPECDLYKNGVVHPYAHCRMGKMNHRNFCLVCLAAMKKGFEYVESVPPPITTPSPQASHAPTALPRFRIMNAAFGTALAASVQPTPPTPPTSNPPRPVMRVIVEFDPGSSAPPQRAGKLEAKERIYATSVYVPNHRRAGQYLYEISDRNGVREVGVIPDHMLRSRSYQGGPHSTGAIRPVQMFLDLPNEDAKTAAIIDRELKVIVYKLPVTVTNPIITRNTWAELRKMPTHSFEKVAEMLLPPNPKP